MNSFLASTESNYGQQQAYNNQQHGAPQYNMQGAASSQQWNNWNNNAPAPPSSSPWDNNSNNATGNKDDDWISGLLGSTPGATLVPGGNNANWDWSGDKTQQNQANGGSNQQSQNQIDLNALLGGW